MVQRLFFLGVLAGGTALTLALLAPEAEARKSSRRSVVELGRRLFMDPTVSRGGMFSCAACHDPEHGFSDARVHSVDENGETVRHSQPLTDLRDGVGMHWDGEFDHVRELLVARLAPGADAVAQARGLHERRFEASRKRGGTPSEQEFEKSMRSLRPPYYGPNATAATIPPPPTVRLAEDGRYKEGFRRAFGSTKITTDRIIDAVEAYVLSLRTTENAFDRYISGDRDALSASARRGLELFDGKANCSSCHSLHLRGGRARFTDDGFHNTGIAFANSSLIKELSHGIGIDGGRGRMSFAAAELGQFKTPSLRDVARRPPYMHNGSLATLEDVVKYYNHGGTENPGLDDKVTPLKLGYTEIRDLVSFLEALTGDERPGLGRSASHRASTTRVRIVDPKGKGIGGATVQVVGFGDRLGDSPPEPAQKKYVTSPSGWIAFEFPDWTHVTIAVLGHHTNKKVPLPDYTRRATIMATPLESMSLLVIVPKRMKLPETVEGFRAPNKKPVLVFDRVRGLRRDRAVYVARGSATPTEPVNLRLRVGTYWVKRTIDLRGGLVPTIDLRPQAVPSVGFGAVEPTPASEAGGRTPLSAERSSSLRGS